MYRIVLSFFLIVSALLCGADPSIIYVHIGDQIPEYAHDAIEQAHLFNPTATIYMLGNKKALKSFHSPIATCIALESLSTSKQHKKFKKNSPWRHSLFKYSLERFFYLEEFVTKLQLRDVFHMEYDNMLYADLNTLLPIMHQYYPNGAVPLDCDKRAIAGIIYFAHPQALTSLTANIAKNCKKRFSDMEFLADYSSRSQQTALDHFPVIHRSYAKDHPLINALGQTTKYPENYSKHIELFDGIFDAAAIGQYLGGNDPIHEGGGIPGFINETALYNPEKLTFTWEYDNKGRLIPFASYNLEKRKIINLHVHCKNLKKFSSKKEISTRSSKSSYFITGNRFKSLCGHSLDEYGYNKNKKGNPKYWFVKTDYLENFFRYFVPKNDFYLVTHNSDCEIDEKYLSQLEIPHLLHWYGQNIKMKHQKLTSIPIGICNATKTKKVRLAIAENHIKTRLVYANYALGTNKKEREYCLKATGVPLAHRTSFVSFLKEVAESYFVIAPDGNGVDTHRLWEALYMGSIPIVTRSVNTEFYQDLPIILLDSWDDFKSLELSPELYQEIWGDFDPKTLTVERFLPI